jgi:hypothetical protein
LRPSTSFAVWSRNELSRYRPGLSTITAACPERDPDGNRRELLEEDMKFLRPGAVRNKQDRIPIYDFLAFFVAGDVTRLSPLAINILREPAHIL